MYRVAICEDEMILAQKNGRLASEILCAEGLRPGTDFSVDIFTDSCGILEQLEQDPHYYQLLLLDIRLEGENGLNVAQMLREMSAACSIIYITAYSDYVFDCFDTRPLNYLLKPVDVDKLSRTLLKDYYETYCLKRSYLDLPGVKRPVNAGELCYLEAYRHRVRLHLEQDTLDWSGTLIAVERLLPPPMFCRCHQSFIVNLAYISDIIRYEIRLTTGSAVPVSKRYYSTVLARHIQFLKGG